MGTAPAVRLLEADPDLGSQLGGARLEQAADELVVRTHQLPLGPWDVSPLAGATAAHVGLLILDGALIRELDVGGQPSAEVLGPGDIVRPWQASQEILLPVQAVWSVLAPVRFAVLDRRFALALAGYPEVVPRLLDRLTDRSARLATTQAISQLTCVDRRLMALFWHLAERWCHISPEGVILPLPLTHRLLGHLVGARRATVSAAVSALGERGLVLRRADGSWLLRGDPPDRRRDERDALTR